MKKSRITEGQTSKSIEKKTENKYLCTCGEYFTSKSRYYCWETKFGPLHISNAILPAFEVESSKLSVENC